MPLFVVVGLDQQPHAPDRRERVRPAHRDYVRASFPSIRLAGAMVGEAGEQIGSLYIFEADDASTVRHWLASEPFAANGVYETLVVRELAVPEPWSVPAAPTDLQR